MCNHPLNFVTSSPTSYTCNVNTSFSMFTTSSTQRSSYIQVRAGKLVKWSNNVIRRSQRSRKSNPDNVFESRRSERILKALPPARNFAREEYEIELGGRRTSGITILYLFPEWAVLTLHTAQNPWRNANVRGRLAHAREKNPKDFSAFARKISSRSESSCLRLATI